MLLVYFKCIVDQFIIFFFGLQFVFIMEFGIFKERYFYVLMVVIFVYVWEIIMLEVYLLIVVS